MTSKNLTLPAAEEQTVRCRCCCWAPKDATLQCVCVCHLCLPSFLLISLPIRVVSSFVGSSAHPSVGTGR